jgi:hypothetical protein
VGLPACGQVDVTIPAQASASNNQGTSLVMTASNVDVSEVVAEVGSAVGLPVPEFLLSFLKNIRFSTVRCDVHLQVS